MSVGSGIQSAAGKAELSRLLRVREDRRPGHFFQKSESGFFTLDWECDVRLWKPLKTHRSGDAVPASGS